MFLTGTSADCSGQNSVQKVVGDAGNLGFHNPTSDAKQCTDERGQIRGRNAPIITLGKEQNSREAAAFVKKQSEADASRLFGADSASGLKLNRAGLGQRMEGIPAAISPSCEQVSRGDDKPITESFVAAAEFPFSAQNAAGVDDKKITNSGAALSTITAGMVGMQSAADISHMKDNLIIKSPSNAIKGSGNEVQLHDRSIEETVGISLSLAVLGEVLEASPIAVMIDTREEGAGLDLMILEDEKSFLPCYSPTAEGEVSREMPTPNPLGDKILRVDEVGGRN